MNKKNNIIQTPYSILIHDGNEDKLEEIYPNTKLLKFYKFAHSNFIYMGLDRIYDICFVATHKQLTKNHHLFVDLLKCCEINKKHIDAVMIADSSKLKCFKDFNYKKLKYVKLNIFDKLSREDMVKLYNESRINILFSGRDCNPRVITESLACGCFNIAFDTLSDGQWIYNGFYGKLIGSDKVEKVAMKAHSISYKSSSILFKEVIKLVESKYDHKLIAKKAGNDFTLEKNITNIMQMINDFKNDQESKPNILFSPAFR